MPYPTDRERDRPWVIRTYAGHSSAAKSNALYRRNLAKGQTGLSVAFDLPTQTGYDPDDELARGEVGKVGVPVSHLGDMRTLFDGIPLAEANTSMTINAPAMWLLALYVAVAEEQGADRAQLAGTTQNDIVKEYLSRGTYVFPPAPSMRLITDMIAWSYTNIPKWNPINICSYHLQEAGATPDAGAGVRAVDGHRGARLGAGLRPGSRRRVRHGSSGASRSSSTPGCGSSRRCARSGRWPGSGTSITRERYGVTDAKARRLRYGVQVNSLGLTEAQPENNVQRIVLEMLAVTLSRDARARAVQLPAWNEALGLPRPWDQQWALRMQQVLAYETDLLEYEDLFDGSRVVEAKVAELVDGRPRGDRPRPGDGRGGRGRRVRLHEGRAGALARGAAAADRVGRRGRRRGEPVRDHRAQPPAGRRRRRDRGGRPGDGGGRRRRRSGRGGPDAMPAAVEAALDDLRGAAEDRTTNLMEASIACAKAGVTTGEWTGALREVFGEFRAPTGVAAAVSGPRPRARSRRCGARVRATGEELHQRLRMLVGKPGLDGHSNGAEQVAVRARDVGFEVVYQGIRLTPAQIVAAAVQEGVHVVGLSVLSGSHLEVVPAVVEGLRAAGVDDVPVVVGGIIPPDDAAVLRKRGVAAVFTPKDYRLTEMMDAIVTLVRAAQGLDP